MKKTGFLYDERFLLHKTGPGHPECPDRLEAIYKGLEEARLLPKLVTIQASRAKQRWVEAVHTPRHLIRFEEACMLHLPEYGCPDNQMCPETFDIAMLAVGGVLKMVDCLMEGKIDNGFCAVRPPGHHAEVSQALGFCYFNNVAIAARYCQLKWGVEKVGIVDFDVHHGNGTQHIFEQDPTVFYYSIHEHPSFSFPGTGREFETGTGAGEGFTLNSPVLPGQGDKEYKEILQRDLMPAFESFKPDVILVSAGFDAHEDDDMSDIRLTTECFTWIIQRILQMAEKHSQGRLISVLEGGYSLERLPELVVNHVRVLMGEAEWMG
ncbi:MAG: histone deacetylase [Deltaproteobacteria bacterium]|nr:histone deacetylase [Deltaproteobacteria bacterium]